MQLIIADGTVTAANRDVMPSTGTPGWATDGNPAAGIPATDNLACHYNMMMAEIVQVIQDAGITLDGSDWTQLSKAIRNSPAYNQAIMVTGDAGTTRELIFATDKVPRLVISVDSTAESGSDVGSNISFVVCGDDGKLKYEPIGINRSTGEISVNTPMTVTVPGLDDDSAVAISSGWVRDLLNQINWIEVLSSTALIPPSWATRIEIIAEGPGGGGANCNSTGLTTPTSGGGGGEGALIHGVYPVASGSQINVLIGSGGAAQSLGGDTTVHRTNADASVDWLATAGGGQGTYFSDNTTSQGGNGGTASGGTIVNRNGRDGSDGQSGSLIFAGDGGGEGGGRAGSKGGVNAASYRGGGGGAYDGAFTGTQYSGGTGYQGRVQYRWLP